MKILAAIFAYNEGEKLKKTIERHPIKRNYDLLLMDDGSTDGSEKFTKKENIIILRNPHNRGIGFAMKQVFNYAVNKSYDVLVIQAGNNKDNPLEIPGLLEPITKSRADFVQGSRFLPGGYYGNTPFYRIISTKYIHPILFSLAAGKKVSESTNGFRAFRVEILKDPRIDWHQDWLNKYELEPYILYKTIKLGYRHVEVPVTKVYPKNTSYTKMKPLVGWWSILRPIFLLWLRLKE